MTVGWLRWIGLLTCASAMACGDDGMPMEMGTSSTGEMESTSSSSSSTGDDTTGSSSGEASSSSTGVEYPPAAGWGDCQTIPEEFACLPDEVCVPGWGSEFFCVFDASGDAGAAGDPCEFVNACNPGLFCASVDYVPDCEGNIGCCTPFCDLLAADPCPGAVPEVECIPWFEEGQAPPGYETLGVCGVPL